MFNSNTYNNNYTYNNPNASLLFSIPVAVATFSLLSQHSFVKTSESILLSIDGPLIIYQVIK